MKTIRYAFARTLPIMAGYLVLGLGFGVLLQSKGYGVGWSLAMSTLIYAGSMQYVTIDLLAGSASLISAALMTLMVNARHLFYGISMLQRYKNTGAAKPYLIFALTDETYFHRVQRRCTRGRRPEPLLPLRFAVRPGVLGGGQRGRYAAGQRHPL